MIRKCEFGEQGSKSLKEKIILIIGAKGSGKSTLINGMINYILGVECEDEFRFKLIEETAPGQKANQALSQTSWITAYTIHHKEGYRIPYTLTIINTPGFGYTSGIKGDKEITEQIRTFFNTPGDWGIDHIDAVGFVVQASLPRLSPAQRYIFHSILALFGKDIEENIFMLVTFADGQKPPVLDALKETGIPFRDYFKFNNSVLFEEKSHASNKAFVEFFWKMGTESYKLFVNDCLANVESTTLVLTKDVLNERHQIEVYIKGIQIDIEKGLNKLEQLKAEVQILKTHEADIDKNKDFSYTVEEERVVKVDIPPGTNTTTCLTCNRTCHYPCPVPDDDQKARCEAMDGKGNCKICPGRCHWKMHKNIPYKIQTERKKVTKTIAELEARYEHAKERKLSSTQLIKRLMTEIEQIQITVIGYMENVRVSIERLNEIALKPHPLSTTEYIDKLIESEKIKAGYGWKERVEQLGEVRKQAEYLEKLTDEGITDPFEKYKDVLTEAKEAKSSGEGNTKMGERYFDIKNGSSGLNKA